VTYHRFPCILLGFTRLLYISDSKSEVGIIFHSKAENPKSFPLDTLGSSFIFWNSFNRLKKQLRTISNERKNQLFLSGAYNPFLRDASFPPIHLNLNYLFDPRSVLYGRDFVRMYDEHRDGSVALNRASPLEIPGVAKITFDPSLHPYPSEPFKPWWKVIVDFLNNEL
jgi:hypothetical protein